MNNKCHLLDATPNEELLSPTRTHFKLLKTYEDESHIMRYLLRCKLCPQLYFFEFYEEIDWDKGEDLQYTSYIPVNTQEDADKINQFSQFELLKVKPRLQADFVGSTKTIRWVK
mgnify:FL=1